MIFADDLKMFYQIGNTLVSCRNIGLFQNVNKCKAWKLFRSQSALSFDYKIGDSILRRLSEIKEIGTIFDSKVNFKNTLNL